ncbi:MAG: TRAP transporter large permease subunit, partial [Desulfotomaculaceae bacterium]
MSEVLLLIGTMVFLLIIRTPIAFGMIIAAWVTFMAINHPVFSNPAYLSRLSFYAVDMFALLAVPFFLLAGDLVQFGLAERLIRWVQSIIGFIRGALGAVAVLSSLMFGAISGSMMATIAAIGPMMMPEMEKSGYTKKSAAALITASGFLGILIPPSIPSLIYATIAGLSVAELFIATVVPGFILASGYLVINYVLVGRKLPAPQVTRIYTARGLKEFGQASRTAVPILLMPIIVLGGIYSGI